ncbi:MAG: OmpA family protein [Rhizobiales bacterium]|nr:OmpA family protein [Hyphomicrobiales bacterium]
MMKYKYVLLAGTVVPGLLLLANPTVAAPGSDMVVAQNCPPPNRMINGRCAPPPPPAAARPVAPAPPAAVRPAAPQQPVVRQPAVQPAPQQPATRQVAPAPQQPVQRTIPPAQQQTRPAQTQPTVQPQGQPPVRQRTPQNVPGRPVQTQPAIQPQGQPPVRQGTPQNVPGRPVQTQPAIQPQGQPPIRQGTPQIAPVKPAQTQPAIQPQGQPPIQQVAPRIIPAPATTPANIRKLDDFRGQRRETRQGSSVIIQEPGRTIIRDGGRLVIQRNESSGRFGLNARNVRTERRGGNVATIIDRPNGTRIVNLTDSNGRLLRRSRRDARGREVVLIDNTRHGGWVAGAVVVGAAAVAGLVILNMRPPVVHMPRERYIVDYEGADRELIYETLMAPPVEAIDRDYSLDEIRYNAPLRDRMPRIDIDTITFEFGSWEVTPDQAQRLQFIADGIAQAIQKNPDEVFLIEGHTDAIGKDEDNLSLSDRRAESVAQVMTAQFGIAPENLTTQGYGEQYLKIPTQEAERRNRRVTIRRITPLLNGPTAQNR